MAWCPRPCFHRGCAGSSSPTRRRTVSGAGSASSRSRSPFFDLHPTARWRSRRCCSRGRPCRRSSCPRSSRGSRPQRRGELSASTSSRRSSHGGARGAPVALLAARRPAARGARRDRGAGRERAAARRGRAGSTRSGRAAAGPAAPRARALEDEAQEAERKANAALNVAFSGDLRARARRSAVQWSPRPAHPPRCSSTSARS